MSTEQLLLWKEKRLTIQDIAGQEGINYATIAARYRAAGITSHRRPSVRGPYHIKSKWDIAPLKNINNIDGQYVIGMLCADGYVNKNGVSIYLKSDDVEILQRTAYVLGNPGVNMPTRISNQVSHQTCLNIGSPELLELLSTNYGFTNVKSRMLPFPRHLVNPVPYLRGYFDGNGHINKACVFTTASSDFAQGLLSWVKWAYGYTPYVQMCGPKIDVFNIYFRKKHEGFIRGLFSYPGLRRKDEGFYRYLPK